MSFMEDRYRRGAWILCLGLAFIQATYAADLKGVNGCPIAGAPADIEVLPSPPASLTLSNTLRLADSHSRTYQSPPSPNPACRLQGFPYQGRYTIYKVWLHEGNQVAFRLEPTRPPDPPADLVLALVQDCNPAQCVATSPDFIGPGVEEIAARHYEPGYYYLFVDSASAASGSYTLQVTGVNPTPDLVLKVTDSPDPVIAGDSLNRLTYTLNVTNSGALNATGVKTALSLPAGVTLWSADPDCNLTGSTLTCMIGSLAINESQTRHAVVNVSPATRGELTASVKAAAIEGDPTPEQIIKTTVRAKSDLGIEMIPSVNPVVAGRPLTYTLRIQNYGPSNATNVTVTDPLPGAVNFASSPGCSLQGGTVTCNLSGLAVGAAAARPLNVNVDVKPSASGAFDNTAQVTANEEDPGPTLNSTKVTTNVIRKTDLSIQKMSPTQVAAGEDLTYTITVNNTGYSDSTGGTISNTLPTGLTLIKCGGTGPPPCKIGPIPHGGMAAVEVVLHAASDLKAGSLVNNACVFPNESDPSGNNCTPIETKVFVKSSLTLKETAEQISDLSETNSVIAGQNLVYTLSVTNDGPSDSAGGTIKDILSGDLSFVSSPDDCQPTVSGVRCTVPPLPAGKSSLFHFVVAVPSGFAVTTLKNQLAFDRQDGTEQGSIDLQPTSVMVAQSANLAVALSASPSPVTANSPMTYTLTVTNLGPSDAADVNATFHPPLGNDSNFPQSGPGNLKAGGNWTFPIPILAPPSPDPGQPTFTAEASVTCSTPDTTKCNKSVETKTILANSGDADLAVTKSAAVEGVVAGNLLNYTLAVTNNGPTRALGAKVEDTLPAGLIFVPADPACTAGSDDVGNVKVTCDLGDMDPNTSQQRILTVRVDPDFSESSVENTAKLPTGNAPDPDPGNDTSTVMTPVLQLPPLVLPFFEAGDNGAKTLLAVKNPNEATVGIRVDYLAADGTPATKPDSLSLDTKQVFTINLRDKLLPSTGYVGITPIDQGTGKPLDPPPALSGDFIHVDSSALAGALPLVSTDTARRPPELCRRWSTRFLNDGSIASSTDFLFFVPGNIGGAEPVAVGEVYTEDGQFVQEIKVHAQEKAFRRTTREDPDNQIPLLAKFGSIEWELPGGVGNIAAVHRAGGQYELAVPGTCVGSASPLVVPYFEVEPQNPSGTTTLFAVRNESGDPISVHYDCSSSDGKTLNPPCPGPFPLKAHATLTVNLRDIGLQVPATGYVKVTADGPISGDFVRVDHAAGRAVGGALVDTDPNRMPPQLCRRWSVRFLQDAGAGVSTAFVFFIDNGNLAGGTTLPTFTYSVYPEDATQSCAAVPSVQVPPTPDSVSFTQPASGLGLGSPSCTAGSVEWDLGNVNGNDVKGNVAAVFKTADGLSVLVPGVCIPPP